MLLALHAFCAGRREPRIPAAVALVALLAAIELGVALADAEPVPGFIIAVAGWAAGLALREREVVAAQLAERARELEEERDAHAALAVRYERARIASDLHDIVAHAVSVMVIQAGAGQRVATDPEATAETFTAIAGAAREAERDMGRLVALLGARSAVRRRVPRRGSSSSSCSERGRAAWTCGCGWRSSRAKCRSRPPTRSSTSSGRG